MPSKKVRKVLQLGSALGLLAASPFVVTSCNGCPDCHPVMSCSVNGGPVPPSGHGGTFGGSGGSGGGGGSAQPGGLVSDITCPAHDCNQVGAGGNFPCQEHTGDCDPQAGKCLLRLRANKQCAPGSMRSCTTPLGMRGIIRCDPNTCDFPSPVGGCTPCGANTQACCVSGCNTGLKCSDPANPQGATCGP